MKKLFKVTYKEYDASSKRVEVVDDDTFDYIAKVYQIEGYQEIQDLSNVSFEELVLHAVLLLRTVNCYESKEKQIAYYTKKYAGKKAALIEYIYHFQYPEPDFDELAPSSDDDIEWECTDEENCTDEEYSSCTAGDYSPSCPWNAPGMSIRDFI